MYKLLNWQISVAIEEKREREEKEQLLFKKNYFGTKKNKKKQVHWGVGKQKYRLGLYKLNFQIEKYEYVM